MTDKRTLKLLEWLTEDLPEAIAVAAQSIDWLLEIEQLSVSEQPVLFEKPSDV